MLTLLYAGNFGLACELDTLLRAIRTLNGDGHLKLLLVGTGKRLAQTRRLVGELGLHDAEFRPSVTLEELPTLLATGDVHVVTQKSRTEGLIVPSKIYGTLAVGRPVLFVGPERCEVAQIVRDSGCGFVVAPGDIPAAAEALRKLAVDAELRRRMGERAKSYYEQNLGRTRSVARIIEIISRVGGNGH